MKRWYYSEKFPLGKIFVEGEQPDGWVENPSDIGKKPGKHTDKKCKKTFKVEVDGCDD